MTQPAWNGRGEDPWLTQRLEANLDVLSTEKSIRNAVWAALSDWLVRLSRRVLRGDGRPPDLDAVWALVPSWRSAVDQILTGVIEPAMRRAYAAVMGDNYPWDQRGFLAAYLAEVRNRLVRTPDEVYDLIAGQVSAGVNLGDSVPQLSVRVGEVLALTDTPHWSNRATVIARTETIGALNAARLEAFRQVAEDEGGEFERVWLSTDDSRTRETHVLADGQRVGLNEPFMVGGFPLMFPGDPSGPPQETIQCRCTFLLVERGEEIDMSNRQTRNR